MKIYSASISGASPPPKSINVPTHKHHTAANILIGIYAPTDTWTFQYPAWYFRHADEIQNTIQQIMEHLK